MEGNPPPTDYAAILADMEAKYAALGNAISSLRAVLATGALGVALGDSFAFKDSVSVVLSPAAPGQGGMSLPRGAFLGKKAPEAIRLYLSAVRKKQTNKEIAQALKDGGLESTGNFDNYVTGGLFRLKNDGVVLRFDDGWGLAEWYPESFRNRVGQDKPQTKKKKRGKAAVRSKTATPPTKTATAPKDDAPKIKLGVQIEALLQANPSGLSKESIATVLGVNARVVDMLMAKLTAKGVVEKMPSGDYRSMKLREMPKAV